MKKPNADIVAAKRAAVKAAAFAAAKGAIGGGAKASRQAEKNVEALKAYHIARVVDSITEKVNVVGTTWSPDQVREVVIAKGSVLELTTNQVRLALERRASLASLKWSDRKVTR